MLIYLGQNDNSVPQKCMGYKGLLFKLRLPEVFRTTSTSISICWYVLHATGGNLVASLSCYAHATGSVSMNRRYLSSLIS